MAGAAAANDWITPQDSSGPNDWSAPGGGAPPTPPERDWWTNQELGLYKGLTHPLDRVALGISSIPFVGDTVNAGLHAVGAPTLPEYAASHRSLIQQGQNLGYKPGAAGEFVGDVAGTAPAAFLGPFAGGVVAGGLLSDSDSVGGTVGDMLLGGIGGKAGDLAVRGLAYASRPVTRFVGNKIANWTQPLQSAARDAGQYVYGLLGEKTPQALRDAAVAAGGKPILGAEALGRPGVNALATLGRRSGTTADLLAGALTDRSAQMSDRILGDYATAAGINPAAARGDMDALLQTGRKEAGTLYDTALSAPGAVWNGDLKTLVQRPVIRKAARQAADDLRNAGIEPTTYGLDIDAEGNFLPPRVSGSPNALAAPGASGTGARGALGPTAQAWDLIKKNVAGQVERDAFGRIVPDSISRGNYNIGVANRDLTKALRDAIPGYGDALDRSGDYLSLNSAFSRGQDFIMKPGVTPAQVATTLKGLSPAELQAFRGGMANKLFDLSQNARLTPKVFDRPAIRQKLTAALGQGAADDFLSKMATEAGLLRTGGRMMPGTGSITSDVMNTTAEQDQAASSALMDAIYAGAHMAHGNVPAAGARLLSALRRFSPARANRMGEATRDEVGRLLMMHPTDLANHLDAMSGSFDPAAVARVSGAINAARVPVRAGTAALLTAPAAAQPAQQ